MTEDLSFFNGKKVLITGGLGTVGSTLAHHLVPTGAEIVLVDCLVPEYGGNPYNITGIEDRVTVIRSDLRDPGVAKTQVANCDVIFNLAGLGCHADSMKDPITDLEMNVRAHVLLLEACRHHNPDVKIVYASTRQIYGKIQTLPVDETHPVAPVDVNGINKASGEQYHLLYHGVHGMRTCALRMTNVMGPRMRVKDSRQVFYGAWFRLMIEGKPFDVWGGEQIRDVMYIDDVATSFLAAAINEETNGRVFNIGSGDRSTLRQFADLMIALNGSGRYDIKTFPEDRKRIDIGDFYADYSAFTAATGWKPEVTLRDAIENTLDYYQMNLKHYI